MIMRIQEYLYRAIWFYPFRILLSWIYLLVTSLRNTLFDWGVFKTTQIQTAVISVGNITVGGSGKTVLIQALVEYFLNNKIQPAILSRGYGRRSRGLILVADKNHDLVGPDQGGDEPVMMAKNYPGVPVVVSEDRVAGALYLEANFAPEVILLDDGFQHRKLHRNINILLLDTPTLKDEHLLPWGRLRESASSKKRADVILYSKAGKQSDPELNLLFELSTVLTAANGETISMDLLENPLGIFAGVGNPEHFFKSVLKMNPSIKTQLTFPDHVHYSANDYQLIQEQNCKNWITTQKDMVKLDPDFCIQNNIYACRVKTSLPPALPIKLKRYFK